MDIDHLSDDQIEYESALNAVIAALQLITGPLPGPSNPCTEQRIQDIDAEMKKRGLRDDHV